MQVFSNRLRNHRRESIWVFTHSGPEADFQFSCKTLNDSFNTPSLGTSSSTAVAKTAGGDADYFFEGPGHVALIEEATCE